VATYKVGVTPPPAPEMSDADYEKMMEAESAGDMPKQEESEAPAEVIPAKYQSPATSGLSYEVKQGGNEINIPLE
jgi:hypothetical protein